MNKRSLIRALGLAAVIPVLISGAGGALVEDEASPAKAPSLEVRVAPVAATVEEGQPIVLDVLLWNTGDVDIAPRATLLPEGHFVRLRVVDAKERTVYQSESRPREETEESLKKCVSLEPGYGFGARFRLARTRFLGEDGPAFSAGEYRVTATYFNPRRARPDTPVGQWTSAPAIVRVTEKEGGADR